MSRLDREKKLMVVFPTTTDAMHMQQAATKYKLPGRMIPLPGGLEAGCGLHGAHCQNKKICLRH